MSDGSRPQTKKSQQQLVERYARGIVETLAHEFGADESEIEPAKQIVREIASRQISQHSIESEALHKLRQRLEGFVVDVYCVKDGFRITRREVFRPKAKQIIAGIEAGVEFEERKYWLPGLTRLFHIRSMNDFWTIASRILPPRARKKIFEPAFEDLKREHFLDSRRFAGKWRYFLALCFHFHAACMIVSSLRVWGWAKILIWLKAIISILT